MREPRDYAAISEKGVRLPEGTEERFGGYGIMGLPFTSGHILGMRRFPASSVGPGYRSVWHRDPDGRWAFYTDVPPLQSCNRYWGRDVTDVRVCPIEIDWTGPRRLVVRVPDAGLTCEAALAPTRTTRLLNAAGGLLPERLWRQPRFLSVMAAVAGPALHAGRLALTGTASNGQWFIANPRLIWTIPMATAAIRGQTLGAIGPVHPQARIGDFWIPQSGIFAVGGAFFEPFDPARHYAVASRESDGTDHAFSGVFQGAGAAVRRVARASGRH